MLRYGALELQVNNSTMDAQIRWCTTTSTLCNSSHGRSLEPRLSPRCASSGSKKSLQLVVICKATTTVKEKDSRSSVEAVGDAPTAKLSPHVGMGLTDTSLNSTTRHRLWVTAGCTSLLAMLVKAGMSSGSLETFEFASVAALSGYVLADLATGVYHWGIDNYGDAKTPLFGTQIDAFQGHHKRPWTITRRQFANNVHALARPASYFLFPILFTPNNAPVDAFLGVFLGCVVFSQQFHSWAHMKKSQLPPLVVKLQEMGLLVSRKMHGRHHRVPYNSNYCIVSGLCNNLLDSSQILRHLEEFIHSKWGYVPRCWHDTSPQWMQEGSYFEDGTGTDVGLDLDLT